KIAREGAEATLAEHASVMERLPDVKALQQALDAHEQLEGVRQEIATLDEAGTRTAPMFEAARAAHDEAVHKVSHAEAGYETSRDETAATRLAAELVLGEPCPVCEHFVERKPKARAGDRDK